MSEHSKIEWTETSWNPVTGCTKVSAGCQHCYAERMAKRLQAMGSPHNGRLLDGRIWNEYPNRQENFTI